MRKLLGSLTLGLGLLAGAAHADAAKLYYGIGVADGSVEVAEDEEKSLGTVNATLGLQLLDFIGVELELGAASDQVDSLFSEPLVVYQAAMLRLGYRWDRAGVYVLGGQARLDIGSELSNETDSATAFGAGLNLFGNDTTSLNIHFLQFEDAFSTTTIGFQHYFGGFR